METIDLRPHQRHAIRLMKNGCVLYGGVGSGKSLTSLSYYVEKESPRDIIVITTARKRDTLDWEGEAAKLGISTDPQLSAHGFLTVDSWNKLGHYEDLEDAFFIFDEQRLVGSGAWVKSFLKIAKKNRWILLSATPGDTWLDYAPLFIANGYFKNITQFKREHVLYEPYVKYPKVRGYLGVEKLQRLKNELLVEMPYELGIETSRNWIQTGYDQEKMDLAMKKRWNPYTDAPIKDVSELFRVMRRIVNTDPSRMDEIRALMKIHPKLVVFYNFDYELEILRELRHETNVSEYNGHVKDPVPKQGDWVYLVQFQAGSEAWECTETNALVLYSLTYSYKNFVQAQGRILRMGTPWDHLYYYILASQAWIDSGIRRALLEKKSFNESSFGDKLNRIVEK